MVKLTQRIYYQSVLERIEKSELRRDKLIKIVEKSFGRSFNESEIDGLIIDFAILDTQKYSLVSNPDRATLETYLQKAKPLIEKIRGLGEEYRASTEGKTFLQKIPKALNIIVENIPIAYKAKILRNEAYKKLIEIKEKDESAEKLMINKAEKVLREGYLKNE